MSKAIVLASGGLDSTVLLYKAVKEYGAENVMALSMFYGQKHAKEQEYCKWQCEHLGVPVYDADLSQVFRFNKDCCALLEGSAMAIKHESYVEQLNELGGSGTVSAYVPFRNGLFLAYAAAVAYQLGADVILYGAHADDAAGSAYPDCTKVFIDAQALAIYEGTGQHVKLEAPWWNLNKAGVVKAGLDMGMTHEEFEHTWSCYEGEEVPCETCGTCIDRKIAFESNGIYDII